MDDWAAEYDIQETNVQRVHNQMPDPAQFKQLRQQMNQKEGPEIPLSVLTSGFVEQRDKLAEQRVIQTAGRQTNLGTEDVAPEAEDVQQWFTKAIQNYQKSRS